MKYKYESYDANNELAKAKAVVRNFFAKYLKTQMNSQLDHFVSIQGAIANAPLVF